VTLEQRLELSVSRGWCLDCHDTRVYRRRADAVLARRGPPIGRCCELIEKRFELVLHVVVARKEDRHDFGSDEHWPAS